MPYSLTSCPSKMQELSAIVGNPLDLSNNWTLIQSFDEIVREHPDSLAISCLHQPGDLYDLQSSSLNTKEYASNPHLRWSYRTLDLASRYLAAGLSEHGASSGTALVLFCGHCVEYVVCSLAAARAGLVFVPLSPSSLSQPEDVGHMLSTAFIQNKAQKPVIVAENIEMMALTAKLCSGLETLRVCFQQATPEGLTIRQLLDQGERALRSITFPQAPRDLTILFTSGTTSKPKGCLLSFSNIMRGFGPISSLGVTTTNDRVLVTGAVHHIYGALLTSYLLTRGVGVIYAGGRYSPMEAVHAVHSEGCTILALVPAMIHGLVDVLENGAPPRAPISCILFAGMAAAPGLLKRCQESFGSKGVENIYGMTEGLLLSPGMAENLDSITCDDYIAAGKPIDGSMVRILHPETGEIVPHKMHGQLHFSGPCLADGYLGLPEAVDFYEQDGRRWLNTGDEAFIGKGNLVYICGRYKEIIVRGGENVSMAKIEAVLAESPELAKLRGQIVALDDDVAGEVPVLVTDIAADHDIVQLLKDTIRDRLGELHVPRDVILLASAGLKMYPLTTSGKVDKRKLVSALKSKSISSHENNTLPSAYSLADLVTMTWAKVLGVQPSRLNVHSPLSQLADSMLMITARHRLGRLTNRKVALSDWLAAPTIADQIKLLDKSAPSAQQPNPPVSCPEARERPLEPLDMMHLAGEVDGFAVAKQEIEQIISRDGFEWEGVQDVFPATDFVQILSQSRAIDTWNVRTAIVANKASVKELRDALTATLRHHPLMISYLLSETASADGLGLHVVMRQTKKALDLCISDYGTVKSVDDLLTLMRNWPYMGHTVLPGLLSHTLLVFIEQIQSAALIFNVSHAIIDMSHAGLLIEDLDQALSGTITPHIPYKLWAESYHTLRKSPVASAAVRYHASKLKDLRQHCHALWPRPAELMVISPERAPHNGHLVTFSAPGLLVLQEQYRDLTPPIVLKAALALVAMSHTHRTHAIIASPEAARSEFPFLPAAYTELRSLEAADVAGPTFNASVSLVHLEPGETSLQYIQRMRTAALELTKYPSVPWHEVFKALGLSASQILPAACNSLLFNYMPGLAAQTFGDNPLRNMAVTEMHVRTVVGMLANAGAGGPEGSQVVLWLHGTVANTSTVLAEQLAEDWKQATLWLISSFLRVMSPF